MRIIAGDWRGRKLAAPKGEVTRPTADRTRETLFSMLNSRLGGFEDLAVLDLFAGSGALGLEALSRGAAKVQFVEHDRSALDAIRANISALGCRDRANVTASSVMSIGPARSDVDLILADPPYKTSAGSVALDKLLRLGWIGEHTWIAVETGSKEDVEVAGLEIETERKVGKAKLTLLRRASI